MNAAAAAQLLIERLAAARLESGDDSRRLLHGRGRSIVGLEQLCCDWFAPVLWLTLFESMQEAWWSEFSSTLTAAVRETNGVEAILVQHRYDDARVEKLWGEWPEQTWAQRKTLRFPIDLRQRQNCGYFLDMEPGRQWLEAHADNRRVLNLFAFTCAFSVVAIAAGASHVLNVDLSRGALNRGRENHRSNPSIDTRKASFQKLDVLTSAGRIARAGPWDVIIVDPPSYQPGSFIANRDYAKLLRRLPQWSQAGSDILLCLNDPNQSAEWLLEQCAEHCPAIEVVGPIAASPDFVESEHGRGLKLLHLRA